MRSRYENLTQNDTVVVEKKIALRAQPIRIPVRQSSQRDIYCNSSPHQKKIFGDKPPVSPMRIPVRQFDGHFIQPEKSRGLRIPIRQVSQKCITNELEQSKERRNSIKNRKTAELLSQALADFPTSPSTRQANPIFT